MKYDLKGISPTESENNPNTCSDCDNKAEQLDNQLSLEEKLRKKIKKKQKKIKRLTEDICCLKNQGNVNYKKIKKLKRERHILKNKTI